YYPYDIPVEVWLMCWSPCSLRQLRRISLVCKLFRSLVLPQLFREQSFDVMALAQGLDHGNWRERIHRLHRMAVRLDRLAEVPSPLWVHILKVFFGPRTPLHYSHLSIDKIHLFDTLQGIRMDLVFPMTFSRYRNLSTLHIGHTAIDPPFREALQSLPKLKDLLLRDCLIHVGETMPLNNLTIILCSSMRLPVRLADPETLHTLAFDVVPNTAITFGSATLSNLSRRWKFVPFLAQCPHLISLSVNFVAGLLPAVSPDIIPRLRSLSAPRTLVHILGPGRPISRVFLTDKLHRELLMPLGFLDPLAAIASLFPGLTELSLEFFERPIFRCGHPNFCRRNVLLNTMTGPPRDRRTLKLDNGGAFDGDMPVDDISDVESEHEDLASILVVEQAASEPTQARSISTSVSMLWNLFEWIMEDSFALPVNIEVFRMVNCDCQLPPVDQHQAIARLSRLYPQLREIKLGSLGGSWVRTGNSWARDDSGFRGLKPDPWMGWSDEWPSS
ncbi:hypothetical protein B0H14DRAFT_2925920, partial [Mycena olivaceomarginata]